MKPEDDWQDLAKGLRAGDPEATRRFCAAYGPALERLAEKNFPAALRRRVGPEDAVQSACRTFLRRAQGGEFRLADSEELWRLLCAITLNKVREQARFHLRHKRGLDQEIPLAADSDDSMRPGARIADPSPAPDVVAAFADQFEQVLRGFDDEERQLVDLRLQELPNEEIAERMGCSERTVRRILKRVQNRLSRAFERP